MSLTLDDYRIRDASRILTPALAVYPEMVDANIEATLKLLGGDADRWRPHIKTSKLEFTLRRLLERGVRNFKCATTLELRTACQAGAGDVLVAYSTVGANARRVRDLAESFPDTQVSALVEAAGQIPEWAGGNVGLFVDINPGMDRTGIPQERVEEIIAAARSVREAGLVFHGVHYYDGHLANLSHAEREVVSHQGYDRLTKIVAGIEDSGIEVQEVVTSGTPSFPCALSYGGFAGPSRLHRVSPGTVVYSDRTSLSQLPAEYGYRPAALVLSRVVSHPAAHRITCDAGHKAVSADAGVPTCAVLGRPDLEPGHPSEEHLPMEAPSGSPIPPIGELLYLVPTHVCPTVNNFDHAILVEGGGILGMEKVTARGREAPL